MLSCVAYLDSLLFHEEPLLEFARSFKTSNLLVWLWRSESVHANVAESKVVANQLFRCDFFRSKHCVKAINDLRFELCVNVIENEAVVAVKGASHSIVGSGYG